MFIYYLKLALLNLRKSPLLSLLLILIMGLGIAVPTTFERIRQAWLHNPMADKNDRLFVVQLQAQLPVEGEETVDELPLRLSSLDGEELRKSEIPTRKATMTAVGFFLRTENKAVDTFFIEGWATDSDFFAMFEVPFLYGAGWNRAVDDQGVPVAVISDSLNRRLFGGGDNLGKTMRLNDIDFSVVGITQDWSPTPRFYDIDGNLSGVNEIFIPYSLMPLYQFDKTGSSEGIREGEMRSEQHWVELDDIEAKKAYEAYLQTYIAQQKSRGRFRIEKAGYSLKTPEEWLRYRGVVDNRIHTLSLIGYLFLTLCLINCVCVLWAKFLRYRPRIGTRRALGASQKDLYYQLMVEALTLGLFGAITGCFAAGVGLYLLGRINQSISVLTQLDLSLVFITAVIAIVSTLLVGVYPAYRACKMPPSIAIKG